MAPSSTIGAATTTNSTPSATSPASDWGGHRGWRACGSWRAISDLPADLPIRRIEVSEVSHNGVFLHVEQVTRGLRVPSAASIAVAVSAGVEHLRLDNSGVDLHAQALVAIRRVVSVAAEEGDDVSVRDPRVRLLPIYVSKVTRPLACVIQLALGIVRIGVVVRIFWAACGVGFVPSP